MDKDNSTNKVLNNHTTSGPRNNRESSSRTGVMGNQPTPDIGGMGQDTARQANIQPGTNRSSGEQDPPRRYGAQARERIRQEKQQQESASAPSSGSSESNAEKNSKPKEGFIQRLKKTLLTEDEVGPTDSTPENKKDPGIKKVEKPVATKTDGISPKSKPENSRPINRQTPVKEAPQPTVNEPKIKMAEPDTAKPQALGKINPKKQEVTDPQKFSMSDKVSAKDLGLPTINQSIKLEESPPPRKSQLNIFAIFAFFVAFIVWSIYTQVDEVAVASGQIIPTGFIKSVQHLEGGIVAEVMVQDGDVVERGQILLRMDGESANSDLEQTLVRRHALEVQAERLRAVGTGIEPNFEQFKNIEDQEIVKDQRAIYDMQRQNLDDQISVINTQIEQKKASLALHMGRLSDLQKQLEVAEKQRDVNEKLIKKRLVTRTAYLESQREVHEVATDANQAKNQIQETKEAIAEQEKRIIETKTRLRNESLREMGAVTSEIAQIDEAITRLKDKVNRLEVLAPSSGVVKGLKATTLRGIIQPGEEIMQIVPRKAMEVEARVEPKDIGNVKVGQNVRVKVSAFDYAKYGDIPGSLHTISASTFKDEEGKPYYRALVKLSKYHVGDNADVNNITPGMTATVDIDTGEKSLFDFFIKPIIKALDTSFRER